MSKFITIGVTGHTGHGKTTLVRSLTEKDFNAKEEKKQCSISIEFSIKPFENKTGIQKVFIDVPGHIRYMKNAIRGVSAVDMAILVIAADDGIMPQTLEHLNMLTHLKIDYGLIVLSKTDLVDDELLQLAKLEIQDAVKGTFFENKLVISCSSENKTGLDEIRIAIEDEIEQIQGKSSDSFFRMWTDQVRSITGFGTVVCGTILSGSISVDDEIQILPKSCKSRIRTLEVHHEKVSQAFAGQRVGINLSKISIKDVCRGMVLTVLGKNRPNRFLNVKLEVVRPVLNGQRVKLYLGTSVSNAMVILMEKKKLLPKDNAWVQLCLPEPIAALSYDRFLICSLNMHTVLGGGRVLEITKYKSKKFKLPGTLSYLKAMENRDIKDIIINFCKQRFKRPVIESEIVEYTNIPEKKIKFELQRMKENREILFFPGGQYYLTEEYQKLYKKLPDIIGRILIKDPFKGKTNKEVIKKHLACCYDEFLIKTMIQELYRDKKIILKNGIVTIPMDLLVFTKNQKQLIDSLLCYSDDIGIMPFSVGGFCRMKNRETKKEDMQVYFDFLKIQGKLIRLNGDCYIFSDAVEKIKKKVAQAILDMGNITIADSKLVLGYGRTKGALVLEYMDKIGFTLKIGNERMLRM